MIKPKMNHVWTGLESEAQIGAAIAQRVS